MSDKFTRQETSKFTRLIADSDPIYKIAEATDKSAFLDYREKWEAATEFEYESDFPLQLDFEITNTCNLRCVMCPHGLPADQRDEDYRKARKISFDEYKNIIDEGAQIGLKSVNLNGINEPFLNPEILEFIRYAKQQGILDIMLNTNATLVTEDKIDDILDSGLTRIMFSLDAMTPETYLKVRRSEKFEMVKNNVLNFINRKNERGLTIPVTRVSFVKTNFNVHEADDFLKFWEDKVDYIAMQELISYEKNHALNQLKPEEGELSQQDFKCSQPFQRCFIASDGSVRPCCTIFGKEFNLGNAFETSIEDIWNSDTFIKLRDLHREGKWHEDPICKRCVESNSHQ